MDSSPILKTTQSLLISLNIKPSGTLVQNEGDSDIGKAIIRLAKDCGITTISIIVDNPSSPQIIEGLKILGRDIIMNESYSRTWYMKYLLVEVKPMVGLNFTDDSQATTIGKIITEGGTLVSYGKKIYKHIVYQGTFCKPVEWSEFLVKKKLKSQFI